MLRKTIVIATLLKCLGMSDLAALELTKAELSSESDTIWHLSARVLPNDPKEKIFWKTDDQKESNAYNLPSYLTLQKLSKSAQRALKKYGKFFDETGAVFQEYKDVRKEGKYYIDFKKLLGKGEEGRVYLCQHENGQFYAVKRKKVQEDFDYNKDKEYRDYKALGRLRECFYTDSKSYVNYIIDLVDGDDFLWIFPTILPQNCADEARTLIAYNLLQELIYLSDKGVEPFDSVVGNLMVDIRGHVYFIDFGDHGYRYGNEVKERSDKEAKLSYFHLSCLRGLWGDRSYSEGTEPDFSKSNYRAFIELIFSSKNLPKQEQLLPLKEVHNTLWKLMEKYKHPMKLKVATKFENGNLYAEKLYQS